VRIHRYLAIFLHRDQAARGPTCRNRPGPAGLILQVWGEGAARATRDLWSRDCMGPLATVLGLSGGHGPMRWAVKGGFGNCCGDPTVH